MLKFGRPSCRYHVPDLTIRLDGSECDHIIKETLNCWGIHGGCVFRFVVLVMLGMKDKFGVRK